MVLWVSAGVLNQLEFPLGEFHERIGPQIGRLRLMSIYDLAYLSAVIAVTV